MYLKWLVNYKLCEFLRNFKEGLQRLTNNNLILMIKYKDRKKKKNYSNFLFDIVTILNNFNFLLDNATKLNNFIFFGYCYNIKQFSFCVPVSVFTFTRNLGDGRNKVWKIKHIYLVYIFISYIPKHQYIRASSVVRVFPGLCEQWLVSGSQITIIL